MAATTYNAKFRDSLKEDTPRDNAGEESQYALLNGDGDEPNLGTRPSTVNERQASLSSLMSGRYYDVRASSAQLLGPRRPRPHKIWKKKFIKVLVVGDSGLGKTTLIKTLLSTPGERLQVHDGTYTPSEQFRKDPDSLLSTVTWKDEDDRVIWVYRVQDTPGYGDELNIMKNINMMLEYLQKQNMKWLDLEHAKDRAQDLSEVEDPRVDICVYCIPPHRLRPIDLRYMFELSKHVPIIPVITKADTMTIREASIYRQEVFNRLQNPNRPGIRGKINTFNFDKETLERAGLAGASGGSCPPFLVIASNDINEEMNHAEVPVFWPERRYCWGTAEAFNPEHSDLLHLRALLLKEALEEIAKTKRERYEDWRHKTLSGVKYAKHFKKFIITTVVPIAIGIYCGRNGVRFKDVKRQVVKAVDRMKEVRISVSRNQGKGQQAEEVTDPDPVLEFAAPPPAPEPEAPKKHKWF